MTLETFNHCTDVFTPLLWKPPGCRGGGFPVERTKEPARRRPFKAFATIRVARDKRGLEPVVVPVEQLHFRPGTGPARFSSQRSALCERFAILEARSRAGIPTDYGHYGLPWMPRTPLDRLVMEKAERIWQQAHSFALWPLWNEDLPWKWSGWNVHLISKLFGAHRVDILLSGDRLDIAVLKVHAPSGGWSSSKHIPAPAVGGGSPLYVLLWGVWSRQTNFYILLPETAQRLARRSHRDGLIALRDLPNRRHYHLQRVWGGKILCPRCQVDLDLAYILRAFKEQHYQYRCRCCERVVFSEWTFKVLRRERG